MHAFGQAQCLASPRLTKLAILLLVPAFRHLLSKCLIDSFFLPALHLQRRQLLLQLLVLVIQACMSKQQSEQLSHCNRPVD